MAMMTLPDGRQYNLTQSEDCVKFLEWAPDIISRNISNLQAMDRQPIAQNVQTFTILGSLGAHLPAEQRSSVATSEKLVLVQLLKRWCLGPPRSADWRRTGVLPADVQEMFDCVIGWTQDKEFCQLLLHGGSESPLGACARLCKSCPTPGAAFLESIMYIAHNALMNTAGAKAMDATGLLCELFRTAAQAACSGAQDGEKVAAPALGVIKLVQQDPKFVRKQLNKESSAAVALADALAAIDQHRRKQKRATPPESARAKLATALGQLSAQATYSRGRTTPGAGNLHLQLCRGKFTYLSY